MPLKNLTRIILLLLSLLPFCEAGAMSPGEVSDSVKSSIQTDSASKKDYTVYIPKFMGTARVRYEYFTQDNVGAFKVRNLRFGLEGYVAPVMSYVAEVEFSDWGKINLVNAFVKVTPIKNLSFSLGQLRVPFTIAAHRQPCEQFFVNRPFLAKYAGIRDVGLLGSYSIPKFPLTVQGAVFNCSGVGEHKKYFTKTYGFAAKLISRLHEYWYLSASTAHQKKGTVWMQNWDIGGYFDNGLWHVEAEYLRKNYRHHAFEAVNFCDFFVYRNFPIEKTVIGGISGALRYDYMGNHSSGVLSDDGKLVTDNPECHRITAGATLSFKSKFQADIRLNYEKYFYGKGVTFEEPDGDRIVLELIAHF